MLELTLPYSLHDTQFTQLNNILFMSKDRLTGVKHLMHINNHNDYIIVVVFYYVVLCIASNCGVYFVHSITTNVFVTVRLPMKKKHGRMSKASNSRTPTNILEGVDNGTCLIGRV